MYREDNLIAWNYDEITTTTQPQQRREKKEIFFLGDDVEIAVIDIFQD